MLLTFKIWLYSIIHNIKYKCYESIDYLPIWNFKQIEKTSDLRYLIKGINYEELPKIYLNINKLGKVWEKIINSYIEFSDPAIMIEARNTFKEHLIDSSRYNFLIGAYQVLSCRDFVQLETRDNLIQHVRKLGYIFDDSTENNYYNSLIDLRNQIEGLKNINVIKKIELSNKYQKQKQEYQDIEDILILFTDIFGIIFDSKKLTCKQYLAFRKRYDQKISIINQENLKTNHKY